MALCGHPSSAASLRLLVARLQQLDQPLLVHRLQRRPRGARLRTHARNLTAEEQSQPAVRAELAHAPRAAQVIRDTANGNAPEPLSTREPGAHVARRQTNAKSGRAE